MRFQIHRRRKFSGRTKTFIRHSHETFARPMQVGGCIASTSPPEEFFHRRMIHLLPLARAPALYPPRSSGPCAAA